MTIEAWRAKHAQPLPPEDEAQLLRLIQAVADRLEWRPGDLPQLLRQYPRAGGGQFAKDKIVAATGGSARPGNSPSAIRRCNGCK